MSMFHELMMRKKEQIMYATIKGTLTENDGVFSGFSASDYLKINNSFQINNNYEVQVAFNYSSFLNQAIFSFATGNISFLRLTDGGKLIFYLKFAYSQAQAVVIAPNTTLSANNNYIVKLKGSNGHHQMLLSSDNGASWELLGSVDYDFILNFSTFNFGVATYVYNVGFSGSIDLNNSYIKIGSTKYKLQAVVGYTVVGSPTESPSGIFSGFSASNYLVLPSVDFSSPFEFKIVFTTSGVDTTQNIYGFTVNNYPFGIGIISNKIVYLFSNNTKNGLSLLSNTTYISKIIFDGETLIGKIGTDENNLQIDCTIQNCVFGLSTAQRIGTSRTGEAASFSGLININETYIKINNKLWFNRQQA